MSTAEQEFEGIVEAKKSRLRARQAVPSSLADAGPDDPEVLAETDAVEAEWDEDDKRRKRERAGRKALRKVNARRRAAREKIPGYWAPEFRARRMTSLALTWPGCPVDPRLGVPAGPWSVDESGVWFRPEGRARQFVCSPVVALRDGNVFALRSGKAWAEVTVPRPEERGSTQWTRTVIEHLGRAGLKLGGVPIVSGGWHGAEPERTPAAAFVSVWLLGIDGQGAICGSPLRRVTDSHGRSEDVLGDVDSRVRTGEALGRTPPDARVFR